MKYITVGILAHVDAGKTTLSECLLYNTGKLNSLGRVDKGNAFLDTDPLEKERGITIFSKQALLQFGDKTVTLLDTPGHVDFSAETERTLSVLDAAILVISGPDKIQSHTRTLWQLLKTYNIPVFIFVNKMDQDGAYKQEILTELARGLSKECVDFTEFSEMIMNKHSEKANNTELQNSDILNADTELSDSLSEGFLEQIASCEETLIEKYLESFSISLIEVRNIIKNRKCFPVFFGSALKDEGVAAFINSLNTLYTPYGESADYDTSSAKSDDEVAEEFAGKVFKITRDEKEERISHVKVLQGSVSVREVVREEKVSGIRIYDGQKYSTVQKAYKGQIVALTGLNETKPGCGIGANDEENISLLTPVLSYTLLLPDGINKTEAINKLNNLAEEQPDLSIDYDPDSHIISISLMGEVQTEVLKRRISERFGFDVDFSEKHIIYRETITNTVEGVGHFEPLRHYAEVHLLMEPLPEGSGLVFAADCSEDVLDRNWQRLVLTHLKERTHRGVLTGSAITDMKITLVTGRAHLKHTEGGDFRQATYRAVRNGLMQAECKLLEPYYTFILEIPRDYVGRAMSDLEMRKAKDFTPEINGDFAILRGNAPVSTLTGYASDVISYTAGLGKLTLNVSGYSECYNAEEVIEKRGYDPERDTRNSADSVFCSHGSGVIVPWDEVKLHMHMPSYLTPTKELTDEQIRMRAKSKVSTEVSEFISTEEVDQIIKNASNANKKQGFIPHKGINRKVVTARPEAVEGEYRQPKKEIKPEYLLIDGYNVIFAWDELKNVARDNLDSARGQLLDILCDYQAMRGINLIAVFDAYRLKNHPEEYCTYNNINVVYTKTAQTADHYIERFTKENRNKYRIRVVTSDYVEQVIVRGENTYVASSLEFKNEVNALTKEFRLQHGVT